MQLNSSAVLLFLIVTRKFDITTEEIINKFAEKRR